MHTFGKDDGSERRGEGENLITIFTINEFFSLLCLDIGLSVGCNIHDEV